MSNNFLYLTGVSLRVAEYRGADFVSDSLLTIFANPSLDNVHTFVYFIIIKTISFYRTVSDKCPVEEHLDSLTDAETTKIGLPT